MLPRASARRIAWSLLLRNPGRDKDQPVRGDRRGNRVHVETLVFSHTSRPVSRS